MSTSPLRCSERIPASLPECAARLHHHQSDIRAEAARGGAERADVATRTLARLGVDGVIRLTERGDHAHELALEAAARNAEFVIAWGGDGTI